MTEETSSRQDGVDEIEDLRARLAEAEETLRAIRSGEVDALVVAGPEGNQIYTLKGAESTYRVLVEAMDEGALVLAPDGTVMYSNSTFADMVDVPLEQVIGSRLHRFVRDADQETVDELLDEGQQANTKRELGLRNERSREIVPAQISVGSLPVGETEGMSAVVTDLTETKRTETELEKYREHLEDLVTERTHQLQMTMEELETTNEELRVTTEDLTAANSELLREVEERKRAEENLRRSEERLHTVLDTLPVGVLILDAQGHIVETNGAVEPIFGGKAPLKKPVQDFRRGRAWWAATGARVGNDDWPSMRALAQGSAVPGQEIDILRADGTHGTILNAAAPLRDPEGHIIGAVVAVQDITERKRAEEELQRYALLSKYTRDIILFVREDGRIVDANNAAVLAYGYSHDELLSLTIWDLRAPETLAETAGQMHQAAEQEIRFETLHRRRDGSIFPVEVSSTGAEIGGQTVLLSVIRDITERKRAEEALRESEQRLALVLESGQMGAWEWNMTTNTSIWNAKEYELLGLPVGDGHVPTDLILSHIYPDDRAGFDESLAKTMKEGGVWAHEFRIVRADSEVRHLAGVGRVFCDDQGTPVRMIGINYDITERKHTEDALRDSEEKYRALFENMAEGFALCEMIWDEKGLPYDFRYLEVNTAWEKQTGLSAAQTLGRTAREVIPGIEPVWIETYGDVIRTGLSVKVENYVSTLDKWFEVLVHKHSENRFAAIFVDVTERKHAEDALRESEERYRSLFTMLLEGFCIIEVIFDADNKPVDYRFLEINPAFEKQTGLHDANGKLMRELAPDHEAHWFEIYGKVALTGEPVRFVNEASALNRWYDVSAYRVGNPDNRRVAILFNDITEAKQAEQALAAAKDTAEHQVHLLQRALIPARPPVIDGYSVASAYIPAFQGTEIGGDFLDVFRTEDGKVGILIGDVSGKGIEAAALAATTRSTVRAFAYDSSLPGDALTHANSLLAAQQVGYMQFVTSFLAILDPMTGDISYSSAGHPPAIISRANGETELLCSRNMPLGVVGETEYAQADSRLGPGDKIVLYTDGVTEARSDSDLFGTEGVERVLAAHGQEDPPELVAQILAAVNDWAKGKLRDDTALLVVEHEELTTEAQRTQRRPGKKAV